MGDIAPTLKIWIQYEQAENECGQEIDVHQDWTIGELKNKILQATGFTFQDQIKIFFEKRDITSEAKTLAMIGISNGTRLTVTRGVHGKDDTPSSVGPETPTGTVTLDRTHSLSLAEAATANDAFDTEKHHHRVVRRVMFSPYFTVFTLLLAVASLVFFCVSLGIGALPWLQYLDLGVTIFFAIEICLRIIVFPHFWRSYFNIFDVVLLVCCLVESIVTLAVELPGQVGLGMLAFRFIVRILRSVQLLRHQREYRKQQKSMQESIVDMQNFNPDMFDLKSFEQMEGDFVQVQL